MYCAKPATSIEMPGRARSWTRYGPGDSYLDAVAQATRYKATRTLNSPPSDDRFWLPHFAETGYPIRCRVRYELVLRPEARLSGNGYSFDDANDGSVEVALGATSVATGRIGLRRRWTIVGDSGQVWRPYVRANLWRDWGARRRRCFPAPISCHS